jgi:dTDP-glucose 4,6-dehydratase
MRQSKRLLVTGGAGFIGSAFIRKALEKDSHYERVVNLDLLTYAACLESVASVESDSRYTFVHGDICNEKLVEQLCVEYEIDTIVHFAAESHVDRSIAGPRAFFETNVRGTFALLEVVRKLPCMHFHHVSTDEVYGSLGMEGCFNEDSAYAPNSPYAASKAASDHFVRAYAHTFGLSITLSHSTNNYGPFQNKEKFLPCMIYKCLEKKSLPLYGEGVNMRDWIHVEDHIDALMLIVQKGTSGSVYGIGSGNAIRNIDLLFLVIQEIAAYLGEDPKELERLISFVADRPGHDFRYAIDSSKIKNELNWEPRYSLIEGLKNTILWYSKGLYVER